MTYSNCSGLGAFTAFRICSLYKRLLLLLLLYTSLFTVNGSMLGNKKLNYGKLEKNKQSIYSSYITHCQKIGYKHHCAADTQYEHFSQTV